MSNLRYYKYNEHLGHKNLLSNTSFLVKACIHIASLENTSWVYDLLNQLQNAMMSLMGCDLTFEVIDNLIYILNGIYGNSSFWTKIDKLAFAFCVFFFPIRRLLFADNNHPLKFPNLIHLVLNLEIRIDCFLTPSSRVVAKRKKEEKRK